MVFEHGVLEAQQSVCLSCEPSIYWLVFEVERNHGLSDKPAVVHIANTNTAQCICTVEFQSLHQLLTGP
jgi:hypothetical protein